MNLGYVCFFPTVPYFGDLQAVLVGRQGGDHRGAGVVAGEGGRQPLGQDCMRMYTYIWKTPAIQFGLG